MTEPDMSTNGQRSHGAASRSSSTPPFGTSSCPRFLDEAQCFPDPVMRTRGPGYRTRTFDERISFVTNRPATSNDRRSRGDGEVCVTERPSSAECRRARAKPSYGQYQEKYAIEHSHVPPTLDGANSILKQSGIDDKYILPDQRRESLVISNRRVISSTPLKRNQQELIDAIVDRYRYHPTGTTTRRNKRPSSHQPAGAKGTPGSAGDFVAQMAAAEGRRGGIGEVLSRLNHWNKLQRDFVGHAPEQGVFSAHGFRGPHARALKTVQVCPSERDADVAAVRALGRGHGEGNAAGEEWGSLSR
jgi:hypothetical protein